MQNKKEKRVVAAFLISFVVVVAACILFRELTRFDYRKNQEQTVVRINDKEITLSELMYYIIRTERTGQQTALEYNADKPEAYWGLYMNDGEQTGYVTNLAKDAAMNYCIRDTIYACEAQDAGMELTGEEKEALQYDAQDFYLKMTEREKAVSGLTEKTLYTVMENEQLAYKYMISLAENYEEGELKALTVVFDIGGSGYEEILKKYSIAIESKIWEEVKVGHVTIN